MCYLQHDNFYFNLKYYAGDIEDASLQNQKEDITVFLILK